MRFLMGHHAAADLPRRPSDRSPAAPSDLGGFYGAVPYSQCPPNDPGYTAKCDPARGGDPTRSGCNINSCEPAGCHAYPGNVSTAGLCMHDPELHSCAGCSKAHYRTCSGHTAKRARFGRGCFHQAGQT